MPKAPPPTPSLRRIAEDIATCRDCPRLATWCDTFKGRPGYWARGVPGFGDPAAQLLILGLAPGAHGANRTGRPFTGDGAGVFLYQGLFDLGLSTAPVPVSLDDGLTLQHTWITNTVKCCPPGNKPTPQEARSCSSFLIREMGALKGIEAVLALGRTAHDAWIGHLMSQDIEVRKPDFPFAHGRVHRFSDQLPVLVDTFHTSRYNVNTGRLTYQDFLQALTTAAREAGAIA